ncbi:MAG: M23 family metallopeptidase [Actinomycetota bacterium]|nr:M23 family metallopeptidase [Actinomycetota bacterium]
MSTRQHARQPDLSSRPGPVRTASLALAVAVLALCAPRVVADDRADAGPEQVPAWLASALSGASLGTNITATPPLPGAVTPPLPGAVGGDVTPLFGREATRGAVDRDGTRATPDGRWVWPLDGRPAVVHPFDPPEERWLPGHRGVDLAGAVGEPVQAVDTGTVSYSGVIDGVGIVTVKHEGGLRSTYQPVDHRAAKGTPVAQGEQIGVLDGSGGHCLLRTCLHLGAISGLDTYLDPLLFLQEWQLSLLPLEE